MIQVSLFTGPDYLIEAEGTVSAHAFLATNSVIPAGGLVVSINAPSLSEFDLSGVAVEGGEIVAVRDGGFDLRMTEYTTLVDLPIAADGETETGETATFSLASGDGYEIVSAYSGGMFNLVDTREDIPLGVVTEPNDVVGVAIDTQITPGSPSFSSTSSTYFDIGNRYLNSDGTYTYLDYNGDVDLYQLELSAGDTVAVEIFDVEGNLVFANLGSVLALAAFDTDGNRLIASVNEVTPAAPDKLFGTANGPFGAYNEDGTVNFNETENYLEFTAPEDGTYYIGVSGLASATPNYGEINGTDYSIEVPGLGIENRIVFGNYEIEIDLLTPDNPRKVGTPSLPVSNPNVTNPPTLSLEANSTTTDSEGNLVPGVVEFVEDGSVSRVNFTIRAEGEIPEGGIEFVLNSNTNLFDYVSFFTQDKLPRTIGGQSLGSFYNEAGIPTGIRLRIEEPTMTVTLESANRDAFSFDFLGIAPFLDVYEPLETDGAENVTFFLQPGEGYEIAPIAGTTEVVYYDSVEDVPPPMGGGNTGPEVSISISETQLIETEGTETTLTFTLSEPPSTEGLIILLDSEDDTLVGSPLSQFDVLNAEVVGGDFPIANADNSGFFFNITEQTATITLTVFDELAIDTNLPPDTFQEGILALAFALQPQAGYTIDPEASEINVRILDNPSSQIFVTPTASSDTLIESEGSVGTLTLSLGAPPPAAGLTVTLSADSLADFDIGAIEVEGGTITEVRDAGLDITLTEREAIVRLPILEDGLDEGIETATFVVESGDGYETAAVVAEVIFSLSDTPGQTNAPEEIEGNSTLSEANALGLSADTPTVSITGGLSSLEPEPDGVFVGYSEDVDFYSFVLAAGQTVALDIDGLDDFASLSIGVPFPDAFIFPALQDIPQQTDHELRLFDAEGNELAANNDGAAAGEMFSRDPYLEFTAETAGTYFVGVSQLGNRNYDPNVQFSGSGWTFPEVGVFFGDYELTATLEVASEPAAPIFGTGEVDFLEAGADGFDGVNDLIFAGAGNDLVDLTGANSDIRAYGGSGSDELFAGSNDRLVGGVDEDILEASAGNGGNRLYGGDGPDELIAGSGDRLFGNDGNDIFELSVGGGSNRAYGGNGNDNFFLGAGDRVVGGDGADQFFVFSGSGNLITGGTGADQFWIANAELPDGVNTITDFEVGEDMLRIGGLGASFDDIDVNTVGSDTEIGLQGQAIAILTGVDATTITESSFAFA